MDKKLPVSYPPLKIAEDFTVEYNALLKKTDKDIDFSDIPELDLDKLSKPVVGKFYHPIKNSWKP